MENTTAPSRFTVIKALYLYLVSFATLMMMTFSAASIVSNLLKMTIFTKADVYYSSYAGPGCDGQPYYAGQPTSTPEQCEKLMILNRKNEDENRAARRQESMVFSISMFVVATPLFALHWRLLKRREENAA